MNKLQCEICKKDITWGVFLFSSSRYQKSLCIECQKEIDRKVRDSRTTAILGAHPVGNTDERRM